MLKIKRAVSIDGVSYDLTNPEKPVIIGDTKKTKPDLITKPISKVFYTKDLPESLETDVSKIKRLTKLEVKKLFTKAEHQKK